MPRIAGVDVPNNKPVWIALTYIQGIGRYFAHEILKEAQIDETLKAKDLSEEEITKIAGILARSYVIEGQLRRTVSQNISRLKDIACYRGIRHRRGLPVRGQSTKCNARTRKGPKKTVAGKKGVKEMR
ncbi:MAG: 30S ribosomal protein S13 [Phycisphaerae bacterium]|nr:30S ribosomal protein S13 [Phycisphaerae bacterium]